MRTRSTGTLIDFSYREIPVVGKAELLILALPLSRADDLGETITVARPVIALKLAQVQIGVSAGSSAGASWLNLVESRQALRSS